MKKYRSIIIALALGLTATAPIGCVVDIASTQGYESDSGTDFNGKIHRLWEHYHRVVEEADRYGAGPHTRARLDEIREGIQRVSGFVHSGQFIPERAQENISKYHGELRELSDHIRSRS